MAFAKLYHRKTSKHQVIYGVRYYLAGQSSKNESRSTIGPVSPRRAQQIFERIRALVIQGIDPHDYFEEQTKKSIETPLSELTEAYIKHCRISNSLNTIGIKEQALKKLRHYFGDCDVETITPERIESWMTSLEISKTTININLRAVRAMFNWGFKREMISVNPFRNAAVKQFKVPESDPEDYFALEEVALILKTLKKNNEMMWRLVFLALETGGRISELLALTGDDMDLKNARILFRSPTSITGQRRHVPLRACTVEEIIIWGVARDKKIFHWQYVSNASKRFRQLLQELGFWETRSGTRSFHTIRHTYASHLLRAGVNIFIVSCWMGHSSVKVAEKHYGHLIPNSVEVELPWNPD